MAFVYTPSPSPLTTVTLPDDGDDRVAASVNDPFEDLADAIVKLQSGLVVVNVGLSALTLQFTTPVLAGIFRVRFDPYALQWLGGGVDTGFGSFVRTKDLRTWPMSSEIGSVIGSYDGSFAFDSSGTIIMPGSGATDGAKINKYSGSWSVVTGLFSPSFIAPDIVWDDVHTSWCIAGQSNATQVLIVYTSDDGSAWTSRTPPTVPNNGLGAGAGPNCTLGYNNGTIVMQSFKGAYPGETTSDSVSFSSSIDGGHTWSSADTHTITWSHTGGNRTVPAPIWDGEKWIAITSCFNGPPNATYVYSSSDGATFTQVAYLTSCCIYNIIAINGVIVGYARDHNSDIGRVVASFDHGVTWVYTDEFISGIDTNRINSGGSRLVVTDTTGNVIIGSGVGLGLASVT